MSWEQRVEDSAVSLKAMIDEAKVNNTEITLADLKSVLVFSNGLKSSLSINILMVIQLFSNIIGGGANVSSDKEEIPITSNGQSVFPFTGSANSIDAYYEGQWIVGADFEFTALINNNTLTITNQLLIDSIKSGKTLEIRKF